MPTGEPAFISSKAYTNELKRLGYKYQGEAKSRRTSEWRHPTTLHCARIRRSDWTRTSEARDTLRQVAGLTPGDVEQIIQRVTEAT